MAACCYHGYADEMQIYVPFKPTDSTGLLDAIKRLEACIAQVQQWMTHKLRLISSKTEFLAVVSPSHQRVIDITEPLTYSESGTL